ncbi:MAG: hypothetical protein ABW034_01470 [Steroidobacteraceae bacterium]
MPKQADPQEHSTEQPGTSTRRAADARHLPTDLSALAKHLQISAADGQTLKQLADEAVSHFESDDAATVWFEDEVRSRYPNLWWSIREWLARRALIGSG